MSWQLVEDALYAAAPDLAARAHRHPQWLAAAVVDRSRRYTSERAELHRPADRDADLAARALFFSVVDAAKPAAPLVELERRAGAIPRRVLDLGAGCGAMSLGLLVTAAARGWHGPWRLTLVDRDAAALMLAERALVNLAARLGLEVAVRTRVGELGGGRVELGDAELVLAGTVLNELSPPAARALVSGVVAALPRAGALCVLEPALRTTARALQALRDELLAAGAVRVLAPCSHERAPCPMLARDADWCHQSRPWPSTRGVSAIAAATGLRDGELKYAYLTLAAPGAPAAERPLFDVSAAELVLRVVSGALPGKGKKEMIVCSALGSGPLRRLDRRASPQTRWFDELRRGDLVAAPRDRVAAGLAAGRLELSSDDAWAVSAVPVVAEGRGGDDDELAPDDAPR